MRKVLSMLLILALAAGFAAPVSPASAEELQAPDYVMEGLDESSSGHDWETNLFFQRMQEETGISFEFRQYTAKENWDSRKLEIGEGENLPDVLFKAALTDQETLRLTERGILIDLKPYLEEYAPDLWALLEAHPDYLAAITLEDGSIRALPSINELPTNNLMWINESWLKSLQLEMPTTAEELTEVLRAFKTRDPNRNARADEIPLTTLGMWDLRFLGHAFGITDNDYYLSLKDGKAATSLTTDENRAFLTWLHELWQEGLLSHDSFTMIDSMRQVTDENAALTYGMLLSNTPLSVLPVAAMDSYSVLEPLTYDGKQVYRALVGPLTKGTFAITKVCPEPEKMIAWVNRLYTEEGCLLLQMGREGEEYFWNENGNWEWMADLQTVADEVLTHVTLGDGGVAPGIITRDFQEKYEDNATRRLVVQMAEVQEYAVTPFPPVYLTEEDAKAVAALQSRIAPFAEKRMAEFVTGDVPLDDAHWESFTAELDRLGMPEMLALWQKYVK